MNGLPPNTPSWLKVFDADSTSIVVPDLVKNKWAPGSTVVITSNDQSYFGDQVRKISHVVSSRHNGHVRLILDKPIHRPQVVRDNVGFAVEVALLSRNIRIEGYPDGHFWVLYTPKIVQMIEGIEFKNMGQKSQLGRYPVSSDYFLLAKPCFSFLSFHSMHRFIFTFVETLAVAE